MSFGFLSNTKNGDKAPLSNHKALWCETKQTGITADTQFKNRTTINLNFSQLLQRGFSVNLF